MQQNKKESKKKKPKQRSPKKGKFTWSVGGKEK